MNLKDTVKYELSELNEQQYLFMNGPAPQLMKRAMKMSYILGQKAIDHFLLLIDTCHENVLLDNCQDYQNKFNINNSLYKKILLPNKSVKGIRIIFINLLCK